MTTTKFEAFLRTVLMVLVAALASWLANQANITGWFNPTLSLIISGIAGIVEAQMKAAGYGGVFGAVR